MLMLVGCGFMMVLPCCYPEGIVIGAAIYLDILDKMPRLSPNRHKASQFSRRTEKRM